jgi:hypothetical protein
MATAPDVPQNAERRILRPFVAGCNSTARAAQLGHNRGILRVAAVIRVAGRENDMNTTDLSPTLGRLFAELVSGAPKGGEAFILNSGDAGLLRSLAKLSAADASRSVDEGATIAAHARHLQYGLSLMNRWAREGGNPFADATWDAAWKTSRVDETEWRSIRDGLEQEASRWLGALGSPREATPVELAGMIASIAHLGYHLGAIRQIARSARGPKEGTFNATS